VAKAFAMCEPFGNVQTIRPQRAVQTTNQRAGFFDPLSSPKSSFLVSLVFTKTWTVSSDISLIISANNVGIYLIPLRRGDRDHVLRSTSNFSRLIGILA